MSYERLVLYLSIHISFKKKEWIYLGELLKPFYYHMRYPYCNFYILVVCMKMIHLLCLAAFARYFIHFSPVCLHSSVSLHPVPFSFVIEVLRDCGNTHEL